MLEEAVDKVEGLSRARKVDVQRLVRQRWEYFHSHAHAAAYAFDPEYMDHEHHTNAEVMEGRAVPASLFVTHQIDPN
jgi:hypothetical protein